MRLASVTALVVLAVTGCGGSARPEPSASRGLPTALAQQWAAQASSIANAAAHGRGCRAHQLASTLRHEIIAQKGRVPARLQRPLVTGVNALADRITCTPQPVAVQSEPPKPAQPPPKPHGGGPGHHHDHGDHDGKDK
jgi:hypothetical protein